MQIVHLRISRGGGSLRSTWSDLLFVPYNAFNVKRRSDTVGVAWPVDLWEMAEVRKRALRREGGRGSADSLCRDLIHAPVARMEHLTSVLATWRAKANSSTRHDTAESHLASSLSVADEKVQLSHTGIGHSILRESGLIEFVD